MELDLSYNKIEDASVFEKENFASTKILNLSHNKIGKIHIKNRLCLPKIKTLLIMIIK